MFEAKLQESMAKLPDVFIAYLYALLIFTVLAAAIYLVSERRRQKVPGGVLGYLFPRDLYRNPTSRVDLFSSLLNVGIWQPLIAALGAIIVGVSVRELLIDGFGAREALLQATWAIVLVQCTAALLIIDFAGYTTHYLFHRIPWLWSFHRAHHSAEVLTFLTVNRSHPLEALIGGFFIAGSIGGVLTGTVLYLLGTPMSPTTGAAIAAFYSTVLPVIGVLHHCHVPMSLGKLDWVLSTPVMHQIHHSVELRHRDKNFGTSTMLYDWLFGTIYVPKERESFRLGLNDDELGENNPHTRLRDFYVEPLRHSWRSLKEELRKLRARRLNEPLRHA